MTRLLPGKKELEKGQAVLVVLLVMSVLLTLGLSVVSRSVTDVKISQQSQESARAFWTAQAGLEKSMLAQEATSGNVDGVDYTVTKTGLGGGEEFVFPEKIEVGKNFVYWLVDHNGTTGEIGTNFIGGPGDTFTVYWGNDNPEGRDTALIVTLISKNASGNFVSQKFPYDPNETRRTTGTTATNFWQTDTGSYVLSETTFAHKTPSISIPAGTSDAYFVSLKMIFNTNAQNVGVKTTVEGPVQGTCYESKATVTVSNVVRNLRECRTWPQTSEIFDYLLFSGGDI